MGKRYDLAAEGLRVTLEGGVLRSLQGTGERGQVTYIQPEEGFGRILLTWRETKSGKQHSFFPQSMEDFCEEKPERKGRKLYCRSCAQDGPVGAEIRYELSRGRVRQTVTVANRGAEEVELLDLAVCLACHTDFQWGENAGTNVIGHHFIAGHGSHATFYRCDGEGDLLAAFPEGDTEFLYYETDDDGVGDKRKKRGVTWLYCLNRGAAEKPLQAGSRLRIPPKSLRLSAGAQAEFTWSFCLAADYEACRRLFIREGQPVAESIPGYTVPSGLEARLCIRSRERELRLEANREGTVIEKEKEVYLPEAAGEWRHYYRISFGQLGEHTLTVAGPNGRYTHLYYFATEPVETLLKKRGAFLVSKQHRNTGKWYEGLLGEWNNESGVLLGPDNYDRIGGWRIYEVTCDDPGLSKPAFLSSKLAVYPVQEEVDALEYYVEHFVWGGLQRTEEEAYAYGIYGIPDWKVLRESGDGGIRGQLHLWRIYDYPHIALMYYNLYRIAADYPEIRTKLGARVYLQRAFGTALAMFRIPEELDAWSAEKTGLYNELVIPGIIRSLREESMEREADQLERYWNRKAWYFAEECKDVFGSEYPFDTTGFESTCVLAETALFQARYEEQDSRFERQISYGSAWEFMENQLKCNIACRGVLEPAYFWYGSDYRGDNLHYTLSYMAQMGGFSLLRFALYYAQEPFELLRLAYGSVLSSYALMNTGTEESGYGWWFPGKENDGSACGGFEPLYLGETWLDQPHTGGAWYYSCEIDLGFCGGIRSAATVLAGDPLFGQTVYGGIMEQKNGRLVLSCQDGVRKEFHYLGEDGARIHICFRRGQIAREQGIEIHQGMEYLRISMDQENREKSIRVSILTEGCGSWSLTLGGEERGTLCGGERETLSSEEQRTSGGMEPRTPGSREIASGKWADVELPAGTKILELVRVAEIVR